MCSRTPALGTRAVGALVTMVAPASQIRNLNIGSSRCHLALPPPLSCIHSASGRAALQRGSANVAHAARADARQNISQDWLGLVDPEVHHERGVGRGGRAQLRAKGVVLPSGFSSGSVQKECD